MNKILLIPFAAIFLTSGKSEGSQIGCRPNLWGGNHFPQFLCKPKEMIRIPLGRDYWCNLLDVDMVPVRNCTNMGNGTWNCEANFTYDIRPSPDSPTESPMIRIDNRWYCRRVVE
jgi:hypothetical protein